MGRKKTTLKEINNLMHNKFPHIDVIEFDGYGNRCILYCNIHNKSWEKNFSIQNCPLCSKEIKLLNYKNYYGNKYKEFLQNKNIELLEEYTNNSTHIKHKCLICCREWMATPSNMLENDGVCSFCSGKYKMTNEEFIESINNKYPDQFNITCEFTGLCNKISAICLFCGEKINKNAESLLRTGCAKCKSLNDRTDKFLKRLDNIFGKDIIPISKYISASDYMKFKRLSCGHVFEITPNRLFNRKQCPICNMSIGESIIYNYLIKNKIEFHSEYTFENLRGINNGLLPYDFYLPQYNKPIEFQGEQHEHPLDVFGGLEKFKVQQEHDRLKKCFAERNNYDLLEIWYYDLKNIDNILDKALSIDKILSA